MSKSINNSVLWISALVLVCMLSRILPHPSNFSPLAAIALFSAAYFKRNYWSYIIPFVALWLSDLFLNNVVYKQMYPDLYTSFVWFSGAGNYLGFFFIALMGMWSLNKINVPRIAGSSIAASVIFFIVSNLSVWAEGMMYPKTVDGLATCYTMAIPFFWNTLLGDLFYCTVIFGLYFLYERYRAGKLAAEKR